MADSQQLAAHLRGLGRPSVLVLGDLILDRYTWGEAERVSPEAPVLVLRAKGEDARLGGAASVAILLQGLDARVAVAGLVGDDAAGLAVRKLFSDAGIDQRLVATDRSRITTVKERVMAQSPYRHPHQILRIDYEVRDPLSAELETQLAAELIAQLPEHDALLVADYYKGVCTPTLLAAVIAAAAGIGLPVVVDPAKIADYGRYSGASILIPNRLEAEMVTGRQIAAPRDALAAGCALCGRYRAQAALMKLDKHGMLLLHADGASRFFAAHPKAVQDVTGAGDMVLAMIGLCQAVKLPLADAVRLANVAAGLEVERLGVAQVSRSEVEGELQRISRAEGEKCTTLDQLAESADSYRARGRRIVLAHGCPELAQLGQFAYLQTAASLGDVLVVAIKRGGDDGGTTGSEASPALSPGEQATLLASLEFVTHVLVFDDAPPREWLRRIRPHALVDDGRDPAWAEARQIVAEYGGRIDSGS